MAVASAAEIPTFEPPAPMAERFNSWHTPRVWVRNRVREMPCWLLSMLSHMAVFILLASLVVPLGQHNYLAPLILQFCEPEAEGVDDENATDQLVILAEGSEGAADGEKPAIDPRPDPGPTKPSLDEDRAAGQADELKRAITQSFMNLQTSLVTVRDLPPPDLRPPEVQEEPVEVEWTPEREQLDEIVDRFIEFDIGNLTGAEGARANTEFLRLGAEAIPSLVYGLNRAAGYQQSCPVCVISRSLETALSNSSDPAMISYALDNIGRGVPDNAPYKARVVALRNRWMTRVLKQENLIRSDLRERGLPADRPMIDLVRKLTLGSDDDVEEALGDSDASHRLAAVVSLKYRGRKGAGGDVAAGRLLTHLVEDSDPKVRREACAALTNLAEGGNLGDDPEAWNEYWDAVERARKLKFATAKQLCDAFDDDHWRVRRDAAVILRGSAHKFGDGYRLKMARHLIAMLADDELSVREAAQNGLDALSRQAYDPAGDLLIESSCEQMAEGWRGYWDDFEQEKVLGPRADSFLAMGTTLEEIGQTGKAAERYRRILDEFPDTPAAYTARRRLNAMGRN